MKSIEHFFEAPCYELSQVKKDRMLLDELSSLDFFHYENCPEYNSILNAYGLGGVRSSDALESLPFIPVRLFKELKLKSISDEQVFKTLTSSGTTGQALSQIILDSETAKIQTKVLIKIVQTFIGKQRLPMLIIDHPGVIKDRKNFSARGAGILGLYNFGRHHQYALKDGNMHLELDTLKEFAQKFSGQPILIFGFTFMVWKYFITELEKAGESIDLSSAYLIHSGGWKKLEDEAVNNAEFKARLNAVTGISKVHNFYGMVEQVGSIFMECESGYLHAPIFSDVIVRDPSNWSSMPVGELGVIQVLSVLPRSYPGHSLLTEDRGRIVGIDNCNCGRKGKYFEVLGRLPKAEVRGCSDTHEQSAANSVETSNGGLL